MKPELAETFAYVVKSLVSGGLVAEADMILAVRDGYDWDQIIDADWFPEPRYDIQE